MLQLLSLYLLFRVQRLVFSVCFAVTSILGSPSFCFTKWSLHRFWIYEGCGLKEISLPTKHVGRMVQLLGYLVWIMKLGLKNSLWSSVLGPVVASWLLAGLRGHFNYSKRGTARCSPICCSLLYCHVSRKCVGVCVSSSLLWACSAPAPRISQQKADEYLLFCLWPCFMAERAVYRARILLGYHRSGRGLMEFIPPILQAGFNKALSCYSSQSAATSVFEVVLCPLYHQIWGVSSKPERSRHAWRPSTCM